MRLTEFPSSRYLLPLEDCSLSEHALVGGKNARLGEMIRAGISVPPGVVVTVAAYTDFVTQTGLSAQIRRLLAEGEKAGIDDLLQTSAAIREAILAADLPGEIADSIRSGYAHLCERCGERDLPVAVRSSAPDEDFPGTSLAGLLETSLWVAGADQVLENVMRCWVSMFGHAALAYRLRMGMPLGVGSMAVGIQRMVDARAAGVMFTLNPANGDRSKVAIEAGMGIGVEVAAGTVAPELFLVDKVSSDLIDRRCGLPIDACLGEQEISALVDLGRRVERQFGCPQDIEWAVARDVPFPASISLVQSRPETAWTRRAVVSLSRPMPRLVDYVVAQMAPLAEPGKPPIIYLVRHGEVETHIADDGLTVQGRQQAGAAAHELASHISPGDSVRVHYAPSERAKETATILHTRLTEVLADVRSGLGATVFPTAADPSLCNGRFFVRPGQDPLDPVLAYAETTAFVFANQQALPAHVEFYRGFWACPDPMGYWLTRDSHGCAETPASVARRVTERIRQIMDVGVESDRGRTHWIMVTHSGTIRALLRDVFGEDPGEPGYCEIVRISVSSPAGDCIVHHGARTARLGLRATQR